MGIHNNDNLVPKDITDANLDTVMDTAIVEDRRFDLAVDADEWLCGDTSLLVDIMHDVLEHNPNNRMIMVFGGGADPYKAIEHLCRAVRKYTNRTLDSNAQTNYYKNGISEPEHQQLLQKYREHVGDEQTKYSLLLKLYAEKHFAGRVRVLSALKEADAMTDGVCNYVLARDADSCVAARTIYRIKQTGICVVRPLDMQKLLKKNVGLEQIPSQTTLEYAWHLKKTDRSDTVLNCGNGIGKERYKTIVCLLHLAETKEARESILEQHLDQYELQQHRLGRQALELAPVFSVSTSMPDVPPNQAFYQDDKTLTIEIVSGMRRGKLALDSPYHNQTTLRQSASEFLPEGLEYDETIQREIFLCIRSASSGNVIPPPSDDVLEKMGTRSGMKRIIRNMKGSFAEGSTTPAARQDTWDSNFNAVKKYFLSHGAIPSQNSKDCQTLGIWLNAQKTRLKNYEKGSGDSDGMNDERREKLFSLEWFPEYFQRGTKHKYLNDSQASWEKNFKEVVASVKRVRKSGGTWYPRDLDRRLGNWLSRQNPGNKEYKQTREQWLKSEPELFPKLEAERLAKLREYPELARVISKAGDRNGPGPNRRQRFDEFLTILEAIKEEIAAHKKAHGETAKWKLGQHKERTTKRGKAVCNAVMNFRKWVKQLEQNPEDEDLRRRVAEIRKIKELCMYLKISPNDGNEEKNEGDKKPAARPVKKRKRGKENDLENSPEPKKRRNQS